MRLSRLAHLFSRPWRALELFLASFFLNLLGLAVSIFVIQVLNRYLSYGVDATLLTLTIGVLLAIILEQIFRSVRLRLASDVGVAQDQDLARRALTVLQRGDLQRLQTVQEEHRRQILEGATLLRSVYGAGSLTLFLDIPFALLFVLAIFLISPRLAAVVMTAMMISLVLARVGQIRQRRPQKAMTEIAVLVQGFITDFIRRADVVRAFVGSRMMIGDWTKQQRSLWEHQRDIELRQGAVQSLTQGTAALMSVAIIALGAIQVLDGEMTVGALIGVNILASRALMPMIRLATLSSMLARAEQAQKRLLALASLPLEPTEGTALRCYGGNLKLFDLSVGFPKQSNPLMESLTVTVQAGQVVVFTGPNGAGKTTLARLLMGLIPPLRGQVFVDEMEMRQIALPWWRQQVSYFSQEPDLIHGTIEENIRLARPDLDEKQLNTVVRDAGLRPFMDRAADGLQTPVLDGGRHLAWGVRRRIALARALAVDGQLALFDEPTEGLDVTGQKTVYQILNQWRQKKRTLLLFSHDPNIIRVADIRVDLSSKPVPRIALLRVKRS